MKKSFIVINYFLSLNVKKYGGAPQLTACMNKVYPTSLLHPVTIEHILHNIGLLCSQPDPVSCIKDPKGPGFSALKTGLGYAGYLLRISVPA